MKALLVTISLFLSASLLVASEWQPLYDSVDPEPQKQLEARLKQKPE